MEIAKVILVVLSTCLYYTLSGQKLKPLDAKKIEISASSSSKRQNNGGDWRFTDGNPLHLVDGDLSTSWIPESNAGSWLQFSFEKKTVIDQIRINSGFWYGVAKGWSKQHSETNYFYNWRIKTFELIFDNGDRVEYQFRDVLEQQTFKLPLVNSKKIRLNVIDYVKGNASAKSLEDYTYSIAEIEFYPLGVKAKIDDFISSVKSDDLRSAKKLSSKLRQQSVDVERIQIDGYGVLGYAIRSGKIPMVELFVDENIDFSSADIPSLTTSKTKNDVLKLTREISELRKDLRTRTEELYDKKEPDFDYLTNFEKDFSEKYRYLFNYEKEAARELIKEKRPEAAYRLFTKKVYDASKKENNYSTLRELNSIFYNNKAISRYLSDVRKQELESKVNIKKEVILNDLCQEYKQKVLKFNSLVQVDELNDLYKSFDKRFTSYRKFEPVRLTVQAFKDVKSSILTNNKDKLARMIEGSSGIGRIRFLSDTYLTNVNESIDTQHLRTVATERIAHIAETERKERLARAEEQKRLEERERALAEEKKLEELRRKLDETTPTGEPNEWQMMFAYQTFLEARTQAQESLNDIEPDNAASALLRLGGMVTAGTKIELESFEKYGCEKADGKPGFTCDYVANINVSGGLMGAFYNNPLNKLSQNAIKTARFLRRKGVWQIVELME